jgi:O-antigen/teichoic acid export membrane protein
VAYYSAAARLVEPWAFVPWALISPLFVRYVQATNLFLAQRLHRQMLAWSLGSGAVIAAVLYWGSRFWLNLVYGQEFMAAQPVLMALAATLIPQFAMLVGLRRSVHLGRQWMVAVQGFGQVVLLIVLLTQLGAKAQDAEHAAKAALLASSLSVFGLFWPLSLRSPKLKS